jgi:hypothetical protein
VKKIIKSSNTERRSVVNGEGKIADTERTVYDAGYGLCSSVYDAGYGLCRSVYDAGYGLCSSV